MCSSKVFGPKGRVRGFNWSFRQPSGLGKLHVGGRKLIYYIHIFGLSFEREKWVANDVGGRVFDAPAQ